MKYFTVMFIEKNTHINIKIYIIDDTTAKLG